MSLLAVNFAGPYFHIYKISHQVSCFLVVIQGWETMENKHRHLSRMCMAMQQQPCNQHDQGRGWLLAKCIPAMVQGS